jgi:HAE1 family hydrophobic/amphiphilic exporter-1
VAVAADDLTLLRTVADRAVDRLKQLTDLRDVRSSLATGFPEIRVRYDRVLMQRFGLSPAAVAASVRDRLQGTSAERLRSGEQRVDMTVRLIDEDRQTVAQLERLNVALPGSIAIPLQAVASLEQGLGPSEIRRLDQRRIAMITAELAGFDLAGASEAIERALEGLHWPEGTSFAMAGQALEMETSIRSLRFALFLAIFLVYAIMSSTFENLVHPVVILVSLPLAVVGVTAGLALSGLPVSVVVLIGGIVLAGVVVNNAIVLVDTINRRWRGGLPRVEAICVAARLRLRPIAITTATTVLALVPLAVGAGEGAEIQRPLAIVLIFGLLSATVLTLIVIPVVYERVTAMLPERFVHAGAPSSEASEESA